jgi:1-acyl-sn-glycerol-3-phosphate acyltransferase
VAESGLRDAISDFAGALVPLGARDLQRDLEDRLAKIPNRINEYGFDPYGLAPSWMRSLALPGLLFYRYYFRAETFGIENLPTGRVLVIGNHAGQLPFDGMVLSTALLIEAEPPRLARAMGEFWIPQIPGFNILAARAGAMVGTPENCVHMLENEECVVVFPEGVRGMNKLFSERYKLQRFGMGFMRLALETNTPIVPVGIVGSEEQQPGLANLAGLSKTLGIPAFPITATFPWLGPLGLWPLPVKYRLYFGKPLHFEGDPNEEDAEMQLKVDCVKDAIHGLLQRGLREREGVFR